MATDPVMEQTPSRDESAERRHRDALAAGAGSPLIAEDAELDACIAALGSTVGMDTEFMRVRTFHPIPALYQLAGDVGVALVDAQAPADFGALKALLSDPNRTKIMHSMSEDLEVMARQFDLRPVNVVDTQVAHAFLTPRLSASYATLVEHYAGVQLDKHETRSDWLQRPLSPRQIAYAHEDAAYLRPIWDRQREALLTQGRLDWFVDEMQRILKTPTDTPDTWYRNLKGIWRLSKRELAVLRSLVAWREREARRRDAPRGWTVADEPLLVMARWSRLDADALASLLPRRTANRYAKALVNAHQAGMDDPDPPPCMPRPLGRQGNEIVKTLKAAVREVGERLGMATELLARKRDLEDVYRCYRECGDLPTIYHGWRGELVGDAFRDILAAKR